jgi:NAD(P)H dehydrogenase (quinone)
MYGDIPVEKKRILIIYHSETRRTMFMAFNIAHGAETLGVIVDVKEIEKCNPGSMIEYDGIIIGSPTYFSNMSWQVKKFIDESASLRADGFLLDSRVAGAFTSSANRKDGGVCVRMIELPLGLHHKMRTVSGVVVESMDTESNITETCRKYGEKIAKEIMK